MPRLIYSNAELTKDDKSALQRQIEGMHFVCGTILFQEEEEPLGNIIAQKLALSCDTDLERAYYNPKTGRKNFETPPACIRCGSRSNLQSHSDLHQAELTDGKECYPICHTCVVAGKMPVALPGAKKRHSQARVENNAKKQRARTHLAP